MSRDWPAAILLLTGLVIALLPSHYGLPFQNLVLSGATVGIASTVLLALAGLIDPSHPMFQNQLSSAAMPGAAHWIPPLMWIVFVHVSRGAARRILVRWRDNRRYGIWSIAITATLAGLVAFAWNAKDQSGTLSREFANAFMLFGTFWVIGAINAALITPLWISKHPAPSQPHPFPLIAWLLLIATPLC